MKIFVMFVFIFRAAVATGFPYGPTVTWIDSIKTGELNRNQM